MTMENGGSPCAWHPHVLVMGVCASCLRDRLSMLANDNPQNDSDSSSSSAMESPLSGARASSSSSLHVVPTRWTRDEDEQLRQAILERLRLNNEGFLRRALISPSTTTSSLQAPILPARHSHASGLERERVMKKLNLPPARHSDASAYEHKTLEELRQKLRNRDPVDVDVTLPSTAKKKRISFWTFGATSRSRTSSTSEPPHQQPSTSSSSSSWLSSLFRRRRSQSVSGSVPWEDSVGSSCRMSSSKEMNHVKAGRHSICVESGGACMLPSNHKEHSADNYEIMQRGEDEESRQFSRSMSWNTLAARNKTPSPMWTIRDNGHSQLKLEACINEESEHVPESALPPHPSTSSDIKKSSRSSFLKKDYSALRLYLIRPFSKRHFRQAEDIPPATNVNGTSVHPCSPLPGQKQQHEISASLLSKWGVGVTHRRDDFISKPVLTAIAHQ